MKSLALIAILLIPLACGGNGNGNGNSEEKPEPKPQTGPASAAKLPWYLTRSAEGKFLCEIVEVLPAENPEDADNTIVYLGFTFPETKEKAIYDRDVRVPRAIRPDGENRAGQWFMAPLVTTPDGVCIPDLDLGPKVDRIALLQVDALVAHVIDEKEYTFEILDQGESEKLRCRAFELVVTGEGDRCTVLAQSFPEFAEERAEYHMEVPPTVATHAWALRAVSVFDKKGNRLVCRGGGGGADSASGMFVRPDPKGDGNLPISYPVTVKISIPTKVRMENVVFQFKNIPMTPYEKAK